MKRPALAFLLLISVGLVGCSTSRVVLLDSGKTESAVVVKTAQGELVLDQPNSYTELSSSNAKPAAAKQLTQQELQSRYGRLINSAPKPPQRFLLYFTPDAAILTPDSERLLAGIEAAIKERIPCDVNIIGHADRTGSRDYNIQLSLSRAELVRSWLLSRKLQIEKIFVESYGEEDPLIPTKDGVAEARNRRVEVLIR